MRARAIVLAVVLVALLAPLTARAESWSGTVPAKARTLAARGRALHDAGDYASAIIAFTQAYVIAPSPALLFNLAQAYRLQGNCDDAALMYQRYLATDPGPEGRALAETHLASVERCLHKLALHIPVESAAGHLVVPAAPTAVIGAASAGPSRTAEIEKDVGVGLTLGGSVALAAALYYTVQANNAQDDVNAAYAKGGKGKDVAAIDQRGQDAASNAKVFAIGGALGIASGIVLYVIGRRTEQAIPVAVTPMSHGAAVSMRWAF
jgi:tetratricopeptide (TPR) repeat protein